jgi:hypothetical protein
MNKTLLIALLAMAGFTALPTLAAESAASAPASLAAATPENLSAPGKPCHKPEMGMGMAGMQGMGAMKGMMGGHNRACPKSSCDCPMHGDMSARMMQLEKRIDALQMTLEVLARQQAR